LNVSSKNTFSLTRNDPELMGLVKKTDKKILAQWAIDCSLRVIHYFEDMYSNDNRPRVALDTLKLWMKTGEFHMAVIRKASLDSHTAAREVNEDTPARSAARAAGQAVATAHVPLHAYGSAIYAQQAVFRASNLSDAEATAIKERDWQYKHLLELIK
jgi:hypothetical protein